MLPCPLFHLLGSCWLGFWGVALWRKEALAPLHAACPPPSPEGRKREKLESLRRALGKCLLPPHPTCGMAPPPASPCCKPTRFAVGTSGPATPGKERDRGPAAPTPKGNTPYPETGHASTCCCQSLPVPSLYPSHQSSGAAGGGWIGCLSAEDSVLAVPGHSWPGEKPVSSGQHLQEDVVSGWMLCIHMETRGQG